jgi:hypothetical protein
MDAEVFKSTLVGFFMILCTANGRTWSRRTIDLLKFASDHPEAPKPEADIYREMAVAAEGMVESPALLSPEAAAELQELWARLLPDSSDPIVLH